MSARQAAFEILKRVEDAGAFASVLLDHREHRLADPRDAALLHEIVLGVLRQQGLLDHVLSRTATRSPEAMDPAVRIPLRIGAYAALFLDRVPDFANVDTAVALARRNGASSAAGFVNAVLRRIHRERQSLLPPEPRRGDLDGLCLRHSHPRWWVERTVARLGWEQAERLLRANNLPAPVTLRPNLRRTTPQDLAIRLAGEGVATQRCTFEPDALRVLTGLAQHTKTFRGGYAWIQDEASQLVPRLFGRPLRPSVADLCAAPGGKSLQLAEAVPSGGIVVAADRNPGRLRRLAANLCRLGVDEVLPMVADMARAPALRGVFDHVLVDAPCSGTGTLRRHPEIRWRIASEDLAPLAARQRALLDRAADLVTPGGSLVYSVCSLEPEEGEDIIQGFLVRHADFRRADPRRSLPAPARALVAEDGSLRTSPTMGALDGFYACLLVRTV